MNAALLPAISPSPAMPRKVLFISTGVTHNGIRAARELHNAGCDVVFHCSQYNLARSLPGIRKHHPSRALTAQHAILRSLQREHPALVIPCDDEATLLLHAIHAAHPEWQPLIQRSLGAPASYPAVDSRAGLLSALTGLPSIALPDWAVLHSPADLDAWLERIGDAPFVLKAEHTAGGVGVRIVRNPRQAHAAFRELTHPFSPIVQLTRRLRDLILNVVPQLQPSSPPAIIAQRYIQGKAANTALFCHDGKVLACIGLESLSSANEVTPCATAHRTSHPQMEQASRAIAAHLRLSGFHGLDFILEDGTSTAWLLELNPRVTPAAHLPLGDGCDLIAACVAQLRPGFPFRRTAIPHSTIAFFPRQFAIDPHSPYFKMAYHDVDWTAPALVLEHIRRVQQRDLVGRSRRLIGWARSTLRPRLPQAEGAISSGGSSTRPPSRSR